MHSRSGPWSVFVLLLIPQLSAGQEPEEPDYDAIVPGLVATFSADKPSPVVKNISRELNANWGLGAPDSRLPADGFQARWEGWLLIQSPGEHRFFARTDGQVRLVVSGEEVLLGEVDDLQGKAINLPPGLSTILLEYQHQTGEARLAIDWQGPSFVREPLPGRLLYHEDKTEILSDRFEVGRQLADRLACANCHDVLDLPRHPEIGPPLTDAGQAIDPDWLRAWLTDPASVRPGTRMPGFGHQLPEQEVADLIAFLQQISQEPGELGDEGRMALNVADAALGQTLFRSTGCLGCHTRGVVPSLPQEFGAPGLDLADLGKKRTADWIALYLAGPSRNRPGRHRPELILNADPGAHLAAYLVSDPPTLPAEAENDPLPPGDPDQGRRLADQYRCASCHKVEGLEPRPADLPLRAGSNANNGCLADKVAAEVPRFDLAEDHRAALRSFVGQLPEAPSPTPQWTLAEDSIRRFNCLGCHSRDGQGGERLGIQVAHYLAEDQALNAYKGTLTPPDLSAVGDKLRPEYLAETVKGVAPNARPWLSVRMPQFAYGPEEAEAMINYLREHDGSTIQATEALQRPESVESSIEELGAKLLGREGFGCVSCHVLDGKTPPGGEAETMGPDLSLTHRRMNKRYFERWIADPQRIIPGTPMPQFLEAVESLPGTLDDQLSAIWNALGSDRLGELAAFGTREVLQREGDRPLVVRDMVILPEAPGEYHPRGVAIGLKNDNTLLFDADRLTWVAWWREGFLYRTKAGRLWEWHPEGSPLWTTQAPQPPIVFATPDGKVQPPEQVRERFGSFQELLFQGDGVELRYHLQGPEDSTFKVSETLKPNQEGEGWERLVRVVEVPQGFQPLLLEPAPPNSEPTKESNGWQWKAGDVIVEVRPGLNSRFSTTEPTNGNRQVPMVKDADGTYHATIGTRIRSK